MTAGGSSVPEVQALLRVLAAGRHVAEIGTAFGDGAVALAQTARSVVTVELDPDRAATARTRLAGLVTVEALEGDWRLLLPPRAPFELVFWDWKRELDRDGEDVVALLAPDGLLVADDLTPGWSGHDALRAFLLENPRLVATEVVVRPDMAVIVAARRPVRDGR